MATVGLKPTPPPLSAIFLGPGHHQVPWRDKCFSSMEDARAGSSHSEGGSPAPQQTSMSSAPTAGQFLQNPMHWVSSIFIVSHICIYFLTFTLANI